MVLDTEVKNYAELFTIARESIKYGVDIVQLRDKNGLAKDILKFSRRMRNLLKNRIPYIINDRVDLAMASACGVHLGQDDLPIAFARKLMGPKAIIGASCQSLKQALVAERQGADYIGLGSVFKTLTKPQRHPMDLNLLAEVVRRIKIPVFAIGGINVRNLPLVKAAGVQRLAVCRAISCAADIGQATVLLKKSLA